MGKTKMFPLDNIKAIKFDFQEERIYTYTCCQYEGQADTEDEALESLINHFAEAHPEYLKNLKEYAATLEEKLNGRYGKWYNSDKYWLHRAMKEIQAYRFRLKVQEEKNERQQDTKKN